MTTSKLTILDGGMGRELKRIGAPFRQPEWSALALMEGPDHVANAHMAFIDAGAQVIATNSYAVVPFHIGNERFDTQGRALIELSGQLARQAADQSAKAVRVAGSLPPTAGSYRPDHFDLGEGRRLLEVFKEALDPHVDLWLAETQSSIAEVALIRELFSDAQKPLWISLTLEDTKVEPDNPRLRSGERLADLIGGSELTGVHALLFNCSQPEVMADAVRLASKTLRDGVQIGVYANAFPPISTQENEANSDILDIRGDLTPDRYCKFAQSWIGAGAEIIGGCCGVGPDHIQALTRLTDCASSQARDC